MKSELNIRIDTAIEFFEREFMYHGNGHKVLTPVADEMLCNFFDYHPFAFSALNRARDILDKYEIITGDVYDLKNHHIRQAYFNVIISELKLIKTFVEGVYIPK